MASSRTCCERQPGLALAAAEQCPDDVGQAPGERHERLGAEFSLAALLVMAGPAVFDLDGRQGGQEETSGRDLHCVSASQPTCGAELASPARAPPARLDRAQHRPHLQLGGIPLPVS